MKLIMESWKRYLNEHLKETSGTGSRGMGYWSRQEMDPNNELYEDVAGAIQEVILRALQNGETQRAGVQKLVYTVIRERGLPWRTEDKNGELLTLDAYIYDKAWAAVQKTLN